MGLGLPWGNGTGTILDIIYKGARKPSNLTEIATIAQSIGGKPEEAGEGQGVLNAWHGELIVFNLDAYGALSTKTAPLVVALVVVKVAWLSR